MLVGLLKLDKELIFFGAERSPAIRGSLADLLQIDPRQPHLMPKSSQCFVTFLPHFLVQMAQLLFGLSKAGGKSINLSLGSFHIALLG
jgi:hypothetical protein